MKILKIFGIVMAVHAFAFVLIFANPGCSSTNRAAPPAPASSAPVVAAGSSGGDAPLITPAPMASGDASAQASGGFDPNAPAIAASVHYSPTRPGTPEASAVLVQPVTDVQPATTYTVASGDSLWTLAKKNHLTVAELLTANNLKADARLKPGQKLIIPASSGGSSAAAPASDGTAVYKVMPGDKLSVIAQRAGTTAAVLKQLNGLKSDTVFAGRDLKLPPGTVMHDAAPSDPAAPAAKAGADSVTYVVKPGESLSVIAKKFDVKYSEVAKANNITDPAKVRAGMTLVIPGWKPPKTAPATAAKAATPTLETDTAPKPTAPAPSAAAEIPVIKIEDTPVSPAPKP
jgi:LysM repeat protein